MASETHAGAPRSNGVIGGGLGGDAGGNGTRVLIVNDDPMTLEILAEALLDNGFDVRTAADAREALAEARRLPPSLVLADVGMPRVDGFQLCAELKQDVRLGRVPVILLSAGNGDSRERARGAEVGAAGYLTTPIDLPGLVQLLRELAA